ncbi:DUF4367 domain-containing protein [Paenibacillus flagellatus]|uniref:DUF4367 domain-containing protein n=1 Tax=Paenibacillus flagellatus TaxID=2211139 RepID=A0A2V5K0G7_9BACL|nr:DUF4367 domain-containing protein [Paenibacillus flagellatus]PYI50933.1 hypothetical protein DLM86_26505 [Paenibacillus flagellatus]
MNKDEFDRLFDTAFEEAVKKQLPVANPEPSWQRLEPKLKARRSHKRFLLLPYVVAASFLIGAFIVGSPTATKAFSPFFQTIKQIQSGVVSFIFGNDAEPTGKARTAPPPDSPLENEGKSIDSGVLQEQHYETWEEAGDHLLFPAPKIGYIPPAFILNDILVFSKGGENAKKAVLIYRDPNAGKSFMITIRMLEKNETVTSGFDKDAGDYKKVNVKGQNGFLFLTKDGRSSLDYMTGNILISISGGLAEDDIIKVADNIG